MGDTGIQPTCKLKSWSAVHCLMILCKSATKQLIAPSLLTVKQCQKLNVTNPSPDLLALFKCESNRFVRWFCTTIVVGSYQPCALHTQHIERSYSQMRPILHALSNTINPSHMTTQIYVQLQSSTRSHRTKQAGKARMSVAADVSKNMH